MAWQEARSPEPGIPELSVVVPMYDEEPMVPLFVERLRPVLDAMVADGVVTSYEVVCVDDGSRDRTAALLMEHLRTWPELRLVRLLRNAGHQAALTAGYQAALGDLVVTIDADLQDPPEVIRAMVDTTRQQRVDVVYGVRVDRSSDTWFKRTTSDLYYRLMRRVVGAHVPRNSGDFRLVTRRVVEAMARLPRPVHVHRLMIPWFGFPSAEVGFRRAPRAAGTTKYPLSKMVALAVDSVIAFSAAPLRMATWLGFLGGLVALGVLGWSVQGALTDRVVPGWASTVGLIGLVGAIQLVCLGALGEYVSRIFTAMQGRPGYLVGFDSRFDDEPPATLSAASVPPQERRSRTAGPGGPAPARPAGSPPPAPARPAGEAEGR